MLKEFLEWYSNEEEQEKQAIGGDSDVRNRNNKTEKNNKKQMSVQEIYTKICKVYNLIIILRVLNIIVQIGLFVVLLNILNIAK